MHVFSGEQFQKLMDASGFAGPWHSLVDLGAGDGATTAHVAHLFEKVYATDISPPMRWALAKRKFTYVNSTSNSAALLSSTFREGLGFYNSKVTTMHINDKALS